MTLTPLPAFGTGCSSRPLRQPQFGGLAGTAGNMAAPLIKAAMENQNVKRMKDNGTLLRGVRNFGIALALVFPPVFFNPQIASWFQSESSKNVALSSVEVPGSKEEILKRVQATLDEEKPVGDQQLTRDLAELGYVREVIASGPNSNEGRLILINGKSIDIPLNEKFRTELREKYNILTVHSLGYGIEMPIQVAAGVSAGMSVVLTLAFMFIQAAILRRRKPDEKEEAMGDRFFTEQIGRFIVGNELGVTRDPLTVAMIENAKDLFSDVDALTREEVWRRMIVLTAGFLAERRRYDYDVSAKSARKPQELLAVAQAAVTVMGMSMDKTSNPMDIASLKPEEQIQLARQLAESALEEGAKILDRYTCEQIELLGEALQAFGKKFTKQDGRDLLDGKVTMDELREKHGLLGNGKKEKTTDV